MVPARILIADDERSIRTLLRTLLNAQGYTVEEAANGEEVMDAVSRDSPPDIVLLDLSIPAPQKMEVLHRLNNMALHPRPRIIVLTANGSVERAVAALKLGAIDFLERPCGPEHLLAVISHALDKKTLAEAATLQGYAASLARARLYLADGNLGRAETHLRAAHGLADRDAEYFYLLGLWHELSDRSVEAQAAYQKAAEFDQHHGAAQEAMRRLLADP